MSSELEFVEAHGGAGGEHERSVAVKEPGRGEVAERVVDRVSGRELVGAVGQLTQHFVDGELAGVDLEEQRKDRLLGAIPPAGARGDEIQSEKQLGNATDEERRVVQRLC